MANLGRDVADTLSELVCRGGYGHSELKLDLDDDLVGLWDLRCMRKVLRHLMSNAMKFGAGKPIDVTLARQDEGILLTVRDRGIGIDPQDQRRVFGRLERAVSDRKYGGLGLGLWVSRRLVEGCGGEITLESRPRLGTSINVWPPLRFGAPD